MRQCEVAYITDPQQRSAEYHWDQLCSSVISLGPFMRRVRQGQWVVRREQYWEQVQQEVLRRSQNRVISDRVKELQEIQQVRDDVLDVMRPKILDGRKIYPVKPGSLEGMVGAFTKLDQLADAKRDSVLTMIEPRLARETDGSGPESVFTPEEMRDVARMLLERRRQQQQARLTAGGTSAKDDSKGDEAGQEEGGQEEGGQESHQEDPG